MAITTPPPKPPLWVRILLILLGLAFAWMLVGGCAPAVSDRALVREWNKRFGGDSIKGPIVPVVIKLTADSLRLHTSFARLDSARKQAASTGKPVPVTTGGKPRPGGAISGSVTVQPDGQVDVTCKVDSAAIRGEVKCPDYVLPKCPEPPPWYDRWLYVLAGTGIGAVLVLLAGLWKRA